MYECVCDLFATRGVGNLVDFVEEEDAVHHAISDDHIHQLAWTRTLVRVRVPHQPAQVRRSSETSDCHRPAERCTQCVHDECRLSDSRRSFQGDVRHGFASHVYLCDDAQHIPLRDGVSAHISVHVFFRLAQEHGDILSSARRHTAHLSKGNAQTCLYFLDEFISIVVPKIIEYVFFHIPRYLRGYHPYP